VADPGFLVWGARVGFDDATFYLLQDRMYVGLHV